MFIFKTKDITFMKAEMQVCVFFGGEEVFFSIFVAHLLVVKSFKAAILYTIIFH